MKNRDEDEGSKLNQEPRIWSEFLDGAGGSWEVNLNSTGFQHIDLLQDYARAYHKAARRVVEGFRQTLQREDWSKNHRDTDAHPIVFLYRQALELYLKTIIVWGRPLRCLRGGSPKPREQFDHNLAKMLPSVKEIFGLIDCSSIWIAPTFQSFADIARVVQVFNEFPHDAFRYPIDNRAGSKGLLTGGVRFNVLVFDEKLNLLLDLLDVAATRTWETFESEARRPR